MANQQRGQVPVVIDLQQRGRVGFEGGKLPSSGGAEAAQSIAGDIARVGRTIGALADRAAATEGADAGRAAGLDPEFRLRRDGTIRGEAFDQAGMQIAQTRLSTGIRGDFAAAFDKYGSDPAKLAAVLDAKGKQWLQQTPPEMQPDIQNLLDAERTSHVRQSSRAHTARVIADQKAAVQQDVAETLKAAHQKAYGLGLDAEADRVLQSEVVRLTQTLSRTGVDGVRLVSPAQARQIVDQVKGEMITARMMGASERLPSTDARAALLATFREDYAAGRGIAGDLDFAGFQRIERHLESEVRQARTQDGVAQRALLADIKTVQDRAEKGYAPSPAEIARIEAATASQPALQAQFQAARETLEIVRHWSLMTPLELDRALSAERARARDGSSPRAVEMIAVGERIAATMQAELKSDPLGWAQRTGRIRQVVSIDMQSEETLQASLRARMAQADEVASVYGVTVKPLRDEEVRVLTSGMAKGGRALVTTVAALTAAAGPQRARDVLAQLSEQAPVMAHIGGLVSDPQRPPAIVNDAADWIAAKRIDGVKPSGHIRAPEVAELARRTHGGSIDHLMGLNHAAIETANAAYEMRAAGRSSFDEGVWVQAYREALGERRIDGRTYGGIAQAAQPATLFGHHGAVLVPPNIERERFRDVIDAIKIDDLKDALPFHGDEAATPATIADIRRGRLISVGPGQYQVETIKFGDTSLVLLGADKRPWVLDLNRLEPALRKRVPAYL